MSGAEENVLVPRAKYKRLMDHYSKRNEGHGGADSTEGHSRQAARKEEQGEEREISPLHPQVRPRGNKVHEDKVDRLTGMIEYLLPMTLQGKAKRLLNALKEADSEVISWDRSGRLLHKTLPVEGSHMIDLIKDAVQQRLSSSKESSPPTGFKEFFQALAEINLPQSLVSNKRRKELLAEFKEGSPDGGQKGKFKIPGQLANPSVSRYDDDNGYEGDDEMPRHALSTKDSIRKAWVNVSRPKKRLKQK